MPGRRDRSHGRRRAVGVEDVQLAAEEFHDALTGANQAAIEAGFLLAGVHGIHRREHACPVLAEVRPAAHDPDRL